MKEYEYLDELISRYPVLAPVKADIRTAYETLKECYERGGKLLIAGNGGSCADSEHIVGELMKGFVKKRPVSEEIEKALKTVDRIYLRHLSKLGDLVVVGGKTDWNEFTNAEKKMTENTVMLVGLLYSMCKGQLVRQTGSTAETNVVNEQEVNQAINNAESFLEDSGLVTLV